VLAQVHSLSMPKDQVTGWGQLELCSSQKVRLMGSLRGGPQTAGERMV
jgi:hypothetical protein